MRFSYAVVLVALLLQALFVLVFDRYIVSDDNCGASDAAVCVESLAFLEGK